MTKKQLKVYAIEFEGIDRCGKSTLVKYLGELSKHNLVTMDRGVLTNMAWNKMLKKDPEIDYDMAQWKSTVFVRLLVDKDDWEVRCKLTDEKPIDFEQHTKMYDDMFAWFKDHGFYVLEFNTSKMTHYKISRKIIEFVNELNGKGNEI